MTQSGIKNTGIFFVRAICAALAFLLTGNLALQAEDLPQPSDNPVVRLEIKLLEGTQARVENVDIELFYKEAPITVRNFVDYVTDHYYDGTIFHRVIDGFMIQGGGFMSGMEAKMNKAPIRNEAQNGLSNKAGTVAMARTSIIDSATSQFFINVKDNPFLDHSSTDYQGYGYCVFGKVIAGMGMVNRIKAVRTVSRYGHQNVPEKDIVILSSKVLTYGKMPHKVDKKVSTPDQPAFPFEYR